MEVNTRDVWANLVLRIGRLTNGQSRIAVHGLNDLGTLVINDPVGIDLTVTIRVQYHGLVLSEIRAHDLRVFWADVVFVADSIVVNIAFASVSNTVIW